MDGLNILLNYSKAVGLTKSVSVDKKFFEMFLQLDYIYRNIGTTEIAKELLNDIKSSNDSYNQFNEINNIRIAYYTLVNKLYNSNDIDKLIEFYRFNAVADINYFSSLCEFIRNNLGSSIKANIFDVRTYINPNADDEPKELNCSSDVKDFIAEMVRELADDIIKMQSSLYEAGYDGIAPDGVLWKVGQLTVEPNIDYGKGTTARYKFTQHSNPSLLRFYQYINKVTNNQFNLNNYDGHMKVKLSNIDKGCYYYPHFQARNSCGLMGLDTRLDNWLTKNKKSKISTAKELKEYITEEVTKAIMNCLSDEQLNLNLANISDVSTLLNNPSINSIFEKFKKAFTTCALISESKKDVILKLKICTGDMSIANIMSKEALESAINLGLICNKYTKVSQWNLDESGRVLTVTFMMDSARYNSFPLFASNILDSIKKNGGPSWSKVTIGRDSNDRMFTLNLASNVNRVLAIIAGSRSGKGVLTLKIESDARALGIPVFYLDYKPDMSKTFYEMARKLGKETFSFDGLSLSADLGRDFDVLYDYQSIPDDIRRAIAGGTDDSNNAIINNKEFAYFTSYVRGVQLMCKLIELRAKAYNNHGVADGLTMDDLGGERILIVLDEIEKLAIYADGLIKRGGVLDIIAGRVKENLAMEGVPKAKIDTHPSLSWFKDYKHWVEGVFTTLASYDRAEVALAKANIIILAQSVNIDETWGVVGYHLGKMIIDGIKLCGNGSATGKGSRKYGSSNCPPEWTNELPNRYFIIQKNGGGSVYPDGASLVKTYFLLNEVYNPDGSESKFVGELMGNLGRDADSIRKEITLEDGRLNPALGYYGYIKELTGMNDDELANTFQRSYDIGELIASKLGHNSLLECMYDLHSFNSGAKVYNEYNEYTEASQRNANNQENQVDENFEQEYKDLFNSVSSDDSLDNSDINQDSYYDLSEDTTYEDENVDYEDGYEEETNYYSEESNGYEQEPVVDVFKPVRFTEEANTYKEEPIIPRQNFDTYMYEPRKVNVHTPSNSSAFSFGKNNELKFDNSNSRFSRRLNNDNSVDCRGIRNSRVFRNSNNLARTPIGALIFKKDASKFIFNVIKNNIGISNVSKVSFINENMIVNNKIVDLNGIVGGDTYRKLSDIISFKEFNSTFRGISYLEMNGNFVDTYILEFDLDVSSKAVLEHLFSSFNMLSEVKINDNTITRNKFTLDNRALDRSIKDERQKQALNAMFNKLSKNGRTDVMRSAFSSTSSSSSKYEKSSVNNGIIGTARNTLMLGIYRTASLFDWLLNGGK